MSARPARPARCLLVLWALLAAGSLAAAPLTPAVVADPSVPGWAPDLGLDVPYQLPTAGRVLRGFEPPRTAFGPGHRGVDLELAPGGAVRAAAAGRVAFAGPVAGRHWVSVAHPDGHLTAYGPLAQVQVGVGEQVERGAVLAVLADGGHGAAGADRGLHFSARDAHGTYLDPLSLLDEDLRRPSLVGAGDWEGSAHAVRPYEPWDGGRLGGVLVADSPRATRPGFATPPNPNHLILVAGLGSSSGSTVLEPDYLGYPAQSVTQLSYTGRRDGQGAADDPRRDQLPYGPQATWDGPGPAATHLAAQLRAQAIREPGRAVDLVGHSMGGLVLLEYLLFHHDPYDPTLPPIGHIVTLGSPLRGSDLASAADALAGEMMLGGLIENLRDYAGEAGDSLSLHAPAIEQLAVYSPELRELAQRWEQALRDGTAGPLATGTRVLNLGGSRDLVVSPRRARQPADIMLTPGVGGTAELDGERIVDHRVVPGGHSSMLRTEAVHEVTWRFLAGEEVVDSPGHLARVVGGEATESVSTAAQLFAIWSTVTGPFSRVRTPTPAPG
ncbi:MAG: peptidoglycan DD-metalloendopeptidase family protein [Nitriliruptoraceae bacterium]